MSNEKKAPSNKQAWFNFGAWSDYQQGRSSLPAALWGLATGTTVESTQKDLLKLIGISALLPLVGRALTTWYLYRNPSLFVPTKILEHVDAALLVGAAQDLVKKDKAQLRQIQKRAGFQIKCAGLLRAFMVIPNLVVRQPWMIAPLALTPLVSGYLGEEYLLRPLRKKFTQNMMEDAKRHYVDEMTNTLLLAQKIRNREITLQDLRNLSRAQRQALLKQLYLATGKVFDKELGLTDEDVQSSLKDADKTPVFVDFGLDTPTAKAIQMVTGLSVKRAALPGLLVAGFAVPLALYLIASGIYTGTRRIAQSFPHVYSQAVSESIKGLEKDLTKPHRTPLISPTPAYFAALRRQAQQQKGLEMLNEFQEEVEYPLASGGQEEHESKSHPSPPKKPLVQLPVSSAGEKKIKKDQEELERELNDLANAIRKLQQRRKVSKA